MAILSPPKPIEGNLGEFGFQQSKFKIEVNNKAFKILIDKLYTNKIRSIIRELSTNAFDSHVMAGCPERPFLIALPTVLDPTFMVRDYGVSISHEDIMEMYVTVFKSTKDNDNNQVGAFGLGSKSPFAYTDSFSVKAYQDGLERAYVVGYQSDGIPSITHISTVESDQETGLEVSFPAEYKDYSTFQTEALKVLRHFPVPPEGIEVPASETVLEGSNWKVYRRNDLGTNSTLLVRQGCVVYPVDIHNGVRMPWLNANYAAILDVPIGSVATTASREGLSLDDPTIAALNELVAKMNDDFVKISYVEFNAQPTLLKALHHYRNTSGVFDSHVGVPKQYQRANMTKPITVNNAYITFKVSDDRLPQIVSVGDRHSTSGQWAFGVGDIGKLTFYVDRGTPMVRRKIRIKAAIGNDYYAKSNSYIIQNPTGKQLSRFVRIMGLRKNQVKTLQSIPDIPPPQRTSVVGVGTKSGLYHAHSDRYSLTKIADSDMVDEYYWMPIEKATGRLDVTDLGCWIPLEIPEATVSLMIVVKWLGGEDRPVYFMTANALKRNKPEAEDKLTTVLMSLLTKQVREDVRQGLASTSRMNTFGPAFTRVVLPDVYASAMAFKKMPMNPLTKKLLSDELTFSEAERFTIARELEKHKDTYPMLFGRASDEDIKLYVDSINQQAKINQQTKKVTK